MPPDHPALAAVYSGRREVLTQIKLLPGATLQPPVILDSHLQGTQRSWEATLAFDVASKSLINEYSFCC